jgi:hypothetical protein
MRTLAQPGDGAKKVLETRSHLDRGRTTSSEKLGHVLTVGCGTMRTQAPASARHPKKAARIGSVKLGSEVQWNRKPA